MANNVQTMILLLGLTVLLNTQLGTALRCWVCSSDTNPMCGDPMNTTEHQLAFRGRMCEDSPVNSPKPVCRKIVRKEGGERLVIRSCSIPNNDEIDIIDGPCSQMDRGRNTDESCHICSTDLCNSGTSLSSVPLLYGGAFVVAAYRIFHAKYGIL